jgi:Flp pilus assembly protein TadD
LPAAEASYRKALDLDPADAVAANNLAWLLGVREKKPKDAMSWANKAVTANPKNANFLDTQGWLLRANGDGAAALPALRKAATLAPQNPLILYHLGTAYQDSGKLAIASQSFAKALSIDKSFDGADDARFRLSSLQPK